MESYSTSNYHIIKATIWGLAILVATVLLLIYISALLKTPMIAVVGWIIVCTVPFLFQRKVKRVFSNKVHITFDSDGVSITEFKSNGSTKETMINWGEIKSYRFQFMKSNITNVNLALKSKPTKNYFFIDERYTNESPNEINVHSLFIKYVKRYNADKSDSEKILTKRNVFSSGSSDV